jgi:serine/threonine-protein kinase
MAPERRLQVERLHQLALQHDSGEREEFLAAQCGGDHELRREVEALLGLSGKGTEPASATATLHFPPGSGKGPIPLTLQRLGKYGLQTEIGRGGFGRVYVAWDPMVDRKVAIKVLIAGDDPDLLVRFRNEASSAGKLHHQNIVTIYDFGEEQGVPFIVMELLDGQNLHQIFAAKTQLALDTKVSIVSQAAAGLHHAHMNGLVHRDVKPGNIMVLPDFSVKLLDFGIARLTQTTSARLTQQGMLIGTANYMSPEQLGQGADSDALSDIFSLGVVAYELLAGRHPFQASSPVAVMFAITSKEPEPLRKYSPDCPAALEDVVMRALAKDRDQRYHSAQDIVLDLEPILRELRQKRASQLVAEAERNLAAEQLESANALLREILDLDPGNTTARRLRDSAQRKLQRRAVKPKIDALLSQGQDFLAGRQFDAARERLDVAFRLDPTDPQIQSLRDRVAAAQAQAKRTDELVEGARKAFHEKNLTGAYQSVAAALQSDPEHPEAGALLQQIRAEIHHQERERALREGLTKARASLKVEAFDEALTLLTALQAQHPDSADLQDLKAEVQQRKAERERREKLLRSLNSARDLLRQRQTVQAIRILEPLAGEFPDNTEVADLLSSARQAEQAEKQAQKVAETERETEKLLAAQDFARAAAVVEAALALYPADATMVRIQDRVHSVKAAAERERAIRNIVAKSEKLLAGEKFVEAANLLDNAVREHGDEAVLVDLRGRVEQAWTAWKRVQARQAAIADARRLLQKGRAAEAVASIQGALTTHPADSELLGLLSSAQKLLADQQRAEAVRRLSLEIEAQLTAGQLDGAQTSQQEGLHKYPGEPALEALGSRIVEAQKAAARRRALQNTQDSIQKLLQAGRFGEALEQIEAALQLDSDEELVRLKQEIETQWEQEKLRATLAQAREHLDAGRIDESIALLEAAARERTDKGEIKGLLAYARERRKAAETRAAIDRIMIEGAALADAGRLEEALQTVEQGCRQHANEPGLLRLRDMLAERIRIAAETKRQEQERERQIAERALREGLTKARASLKVEAFDEALTLLTALQAQHPDSADLRDLKAEVQQRKAERERREKLLRSLSSARDLLRQRQPAQAIRILEPLAGEFPDNAEVADLLSSARQAEQAEKQAQKVAETERETEKLLAAQDFARAAAVVEAALALYPADATMVRIRDRVRSVKAAAERERAIRSIVAKSEKLLAGEKFVEAANLLDNAVREHGDEAVLVDLRGRVEQAWTAWKRVQARQAAIADARRLLQKGRAAEAVASIQGALTAHPADSELLGLLSSAQKLLADQQRAEAVRRLSLEIEAQLTAGQLDQAQASQQEGLHKYPGEPALEALGSRIAEAQKAAARRRALQNTQDSIQKLLQAGRFAEALEQIEAALQLDSDEELVRLKQEIETQWEREKVRATLAQAREHLDAGRIDESIALLEAAARERTDKVEIKGLLAYARERRKAAETRAAIDRIMIEGAALADAGRLEEALQTVEQGCRQYASEPGLLRLRDMLAERLRIAEQRRLEAERARLEAERQRQEEEARKRREEEARLREEADRKRRAEEDRQAVEVLERAGQLRQERATEAALKLLEEAIARLGHRPALDELQEQIRADQRRALSARQTLDRARAALEQGQINVATQLASYLETELPGEVDTEDLQASIAAKVEQQRVQAAIEAAAQQALILRDQGRFEEALSLLDMELREHPGAQVLESARDRIRSDHQTFLLEQARKEALAEISILPLSARRASDESELQKVVARAEEIAAAYSSDKQFKQAAKAASKAVARRRAEWKKIQTAAEAAPAPRWRRAIAAGVIVGLSLGALIWKLSSSRGATLQVSTNPPGARVTAGKMSCITPNCALDLPPGSYRIQAQKAGYRAASANVEIGKGSRVPVELTLVPLPTRLLVGANFTRGTVTLDGSEAGQLRNGEFVLDSVPEGTHTLNIRSPEGQATLHFEQTAGQPAKILSAPSVNQTQAIVVSGSASAAEIRCDCISGEVTVDGKPAGRLEGGRLALPGLAQGTHQFRVTAPDGIRDSVVALQENPSLNLFLTADRDVGTLVVEAGQDDVQVFMDNRPLAALTHDGLVRLTLPVKQYSVRVEKKGYRQPLAKSVEVKKGELARLLFKLAPLDAVLAIREAMPRVRVLIDGQAVGTTGADGTLLVNNITPGDHGIELTRDGYSPRRWNRKFDPGATVNLGRGDVSLAEIQASPLPPPPSPPVKQTPPAPDPRAVEAEEWDRVRNTRNVDQLEEFRHKYPTGANSEQAARRIEQIEWDNLQNTRDPTAFQAFADKYPNGSHADQARRRIEDLEWARVDKQNAGQIRAFLQQHPGSLQAPDASAALAALQQVERLAADRLAINQVLVQYQQAYAAKNLAELLVLRPSLAGSRAEKEIRDAFHASRSIALQLVPIREPEVSEDTAAVQCRETTKETVDKRPLPEHNETVTITLRRSGQTWIIQDIK